MKIDLNKKEKIWFIGIGISILALPIILTQFPVIVSFNNTGPIGDTIGGITAPFLSFFGSVLVYLALRSQIDANEEFKRQFVKQNEDSLFFRLFDNFKNKIIQYNNIFISSEKSRDIKEIEALVYIAKEFNRMLHQGFNDFSIEYIAINHNNISDEIYKKILFFHKNNKSVEINNIEELKERIKVETDISKRTSFLSEITSNFYGDKMNEIRELGREKWYEVPFELRYKYYKKAYEEVSKEFGGFLDSFNTDIIFILNVLKTINYNKFYINYLKMSLTNYEKLILFYFCFTKDGQKHKLDIYNYGLLDSLIDKPNFFIFKISEQQIKNEIENLAKFNF